MARNLGLLVATILILAACLSAPFLYQDRFDQRHAAIFDEITVGASRDRLVALAGSPSYVTDGTRWVDPEYEKSPGQLTPGCIEEYWYESGVPFLPSKWSYCLDEKGVVLDKDHWFSW